LSSLLLKQEWLRISEPSNPVSAKRMSAFEIDQLVNQRRLQWAIENDEPDDAAKALTNLGFFEDAAAVASTPEIADRATRRVVALDATPCDCPKPTLLMKEGNREIAKTVSNFFAVKQYPQGTLWRCSDCGDDVLLDGFPDEHTQRRAEAMANFPTADKGNDFQVLANATKS